MDKTKVTIVALATIAAILAIVVVYVFVIKPSITNYTVDKQNEGIQFAVVQIAQAAAQCQPVPVPLGIDSNQTINLVAVECFPDRFPELEGQSETNTGE